MSIKYEIHGIKNAKGEGKEQKYVHLFAHEPQSDHALEDDIQASCSLTKADVRAAFSALRDHMARALASGSRFHLPGVGYFSLSVGLDAPDDLPSDKMRADYIRLRNIRFRPELVAQRGRQRCQLRACRLLLTFAPVHRVRVSLAPPPLFRHPHLPHSPHPAARGRLARERSKEMAAASHCHRRAAERRRKQCAGVFMERVRGRNCN